MLKATKRNLNILPKPLIRLVPADQHLVGGGLEGEAEAEQALEGGGGVVPAIEAEDELVQVGRLGGAPTAARGRRPTPTASRSRTRGGSRAGRGAPARRRSPSGRA